MSNIYPVWTPDDFDQVVADAQAVVAAGKARRLELVPDPVESRVFSRSRFRRARLMDGLAVTLLLILMACLGVIVWAASAKADADDYAGIYGGAVCATLDSGHATTNGLLGIMQAIEGQGLTRYEAGEVVGISVLTECPRHTGLLNQFVTVYGDGVVA